jgi:hypothetical protein
MPIVECPSRSLTALELTALNTRAISSAIHSKRVIHSVMRITKTAEARRLGSLSRHRTTEGSFTMSGRTTFADKVSMRPWVGARILVPLAAVLLALNVGVAIASGPADRQTSNVYMFVEPDPVQVMGADARLTRTDSGVGYNLRTSGLEKGHAVSIWWVIFNNPEHCTDGEGGAACGMGDLFETDVNVAVMSGGGHAIGGSGRANFAGHLTVGQITNEHPAFLDGPGLTNPRGAEIHLIVRTHGPLIPGMNHGMFNSFEVGCDVNDCEDLQFAVFVAP